MKRINRLPIIFVTLAPAIFTGVFLLGKMGFGTLVSLTSYPVYALATTAIWVFLLILLLRSRDGLAAVLLVCLFYVDGFFALTLWSLTFLAPVVVLAGDYPMVRDMTRSFIAASAGASTIAAFAIYRAWSRDLLDEKIPPFPWGRKGRRVK